MADGDDSLSDEQQAAALVLAQGQGVARAAEVGRVSERTIYRWRLEPDFKDRVSELRSAMYAEAAGRLALIVSKTVIRLHELSKSKNLPVALGACRCIMEQTARTREQQDLAEEVAEQRQLVAELKAQMEEVRNGAGATAGAAGESPARRDWAGDLGGEHHATGEGRGGSTATAPRGR